MDTDMIQINAALTDKINHFYRSNSYTSPKFYGHHDQNDVNNGNPPLNKIDIWNAGAITLAAIISAIIGLPIISSIAIFYLWKHIQKNPRNIRAKYNAYTYVFITSALCYGAYMNNQPEPYIKYLYIINIVLCLTAVIYNIYCQRDPWKNTMYQNITNIDPEMEKLFGNKNYIHMGYNHPNHLILAERALLMGNQRSDIEQQLYAISCEIPYIYLRPNSYITAYTTTPANILSQYKDKEMSDVAQGIETEIEKHRENKLIQPMDTSSYGELYTITCNDGYLRLLRVEDPAKNNAPVWMIVPHIMATAHEAVAWTFQTYPDNYTPNIQC